MGFSLSRTLGLGNTSFADSVDRVGRLSVDPFNILGTHKKDPETFDQSASGQRRDAAYNTGATRGQKEFYDDPDMQMLRKRREDLSQGYEGKELGALRGEARGQVAGQASNYLRQLQGQQARAGVGGARGAAMQNAARQNFAQQGADAERKLLIDSGQMKRQGVNDLQDYITRQKLGKLGLAYGEQALSSADYAAEKGVQAASSGGKK
jgi:hypothetical protein